MKIVTTIVYFIVLLGTAIVCYLKPEYNWDAIPYTALVVKTNNSNSDSVHAKTYRLVKTALSPAKYNSLIDSNNSYRYTLYKDSKAFEKELTYYSIKPLYILSIAAANKLGVPLPRATVVPSVIAFLLIGILLYIWIDKVFISEYAPSVSLVILLSPFILFVARSSVPDLINAFFLLTGVFLITEKKYMFLGITVLCLAVAVRFDSLLFVIVITLYLLSVHKLNTTHVILLGVLCGLFFVYALLYQTFPVERVFFAQAATERIHQENHHSFFFLYFSGLINGLLASLLYSTIVIMTFIFAVTVYLKRIVLKARWSDPALFLLLLVQAHIMLRYVLHPVVEDRFIIANYIIILISFIKSVIDVTQHVPSEIDYV